MAKDEDLAANCPTDRVLTIPFLPTLLNIMSFCSQCPQLGTNLNLNVNYCPSIDVVEEEIVMNFETDNGQCDIALGSFAIDNFFLKSTDN